MDDVNEIIDAAKRCLNCKNRPCMDACPIKTHVPEFISKVKEKDFESAYNILIDNNIFSNICSIVCPQEIQCEGSCVRGIKEKGVQIGRLERFVNEWANENNYSKEIKLTKSNNKKVAVIGSGPAGLSCAAELIKKGFKVTVFEKESKLGGLLRYGIPEFRLEKEILDNVIEKLKYLGIQFITKKEFGKDITLESLKKQNYEAVFLGLGAASSSTYELSKENYNSVYKSDYFLKQYNENNYIKNLGTTIVIGGGNVALDSARVAKKMGAEEVYVLYRRDRENMPSTKKEVEDTLKDNIKIEYRTKVIKAMGKGEKLEQIECIKTEVIEGKAVDISNTNFIMNVDTVVFAIGNNPDKKLLEKTELIIENGIIKVDENGMTNFEGVFAGGDVSENKATVCRAIASGKKAAEGIEKYLSI